MMYSALIIATLFMLQQVDGGNVSVPEGHWRISAVGESVLRCPYGATSCVGGSSAGDFLCSDGFAGLLCADPVQDHYIEWTAQDAHFCDDATTLESFAIPVLVLLSMLIFICRNVGLREGARKQRDNPSCFKISSPHVQRPASLHNAPSSPASLVSASSPASVQVVNAHRPHSCTSTPTSVRSARPVSSPTLSVVATSVAAENDETVENTGEGGDDHAADANFDLLHKIKILKFAMQISSSLPSVLHTSFGPYLSSLLQYFSYLSVASLQALPWPCFASSALFTGAGELRTMSYMELMQTASILPLAGLAVVCVLYALHMECVHLVTQDEDKEHQRILHDRYTRKYGTAVLLVLYISQAGAWQLLSGVLFSPCVQTDPDHTVMTGNAAYRVMLMDPSVQCASSTYQFGYLWAVVGAIIYAFAVPMVEVLLVYLYSDHITMYHHHNTLSTTTLTNNTNITNNKHSVNATVAVPATLSKKFSAKYNNKFNNNKFTSKYPNKDLSKPHKLNGRLSSHFHIYISSSSSDSSSSEESDLDIENSKSFKRYPLDGFKSSSLSDKLGLRAAFSQSKGKGRSYEILRKRSANHYFGGVGLLYQAYKSDRCYWEIVDSFYRLFFVALLPALFPYTNPMQLLVGIAVTLLFIQIQLHYKPFVNPANERLMQCALVQIFLLLVCTMGSELDLPDVHYGSLHVYDGFMCLVALLTPLLFLYQTLFTTYTPTTSATSATTITNANNLAVTSPSVRTHRPHAAVLHNNRRNSFSECDTASEGERCTPRHSRCHSSRRYGSRSSSQRYSRKQSGISCTNGGKSPKSVRSSKGGKEAVRGSSSRKLRRSSSTAEYSYRSTHSVENSEEHKEDGVRFSVNKQGLLLSTPPRQSRNNNTGSPHRPYNATHNTTTNNIIRAPAIPTMFTFDRDLAVYTHETVTYDQLSAEKAAREQNTHNVSHADHLSQSFVYQSEEEHSSGVSNNGLHTPLYQSESDNLTESEEEKRGEWSTDEDNNCGSPKYALNMATTSYNSITLSNKQRLYTNRDSKHHYSAHNNISAHDNADYYTERNTAMNRVSVLRAPSPVSTPPHSDLDYDSAGSFGRNNTTGNTTDVHVVRSTYSPSSSISGSVKSNQPSPAGAPVKSDRPIWHSMFSDQSEDEEEPPLRRIPFIFTNPQTVTNNNNSYDQTTAATTVTTPAKPIRAMPTPLLLAPLHINSKLNLAVQTSGTSSKYANRPLPPLPPLPAVLSSPVAESTNSEYNNNNVSTPVSPLVEYENSSIYSHDSAFTGANVLATLHSMPSMASMANMPSVPVLAKEESKDGKADIHADLGVNIINNYSEVAPLHNTEFSAPNKTSPVEPLRPPIIMTVKYHSSSEDSNEGSVEGTMTTLFGNHRNKATVHSPGRVIVKPVYNNKGIWGMMRSAFGGGHNDTNTAKAPVHPLNSGLSGILLRTMTDIDLNDLADRESENSDNGNVYNNRVYRSKSDSSGDNIEACYAYEGSSNFTEGCVNGDYDV